MRRIGLHIAYLMLLLATGCGGLQPHDSTRSSKENDVENPIDRQKVLRIAIREFEPFSQAIGREWESFQRESGCKLQLEAVSMDHHPLYETLFEKEGLKSGDWDVAFINTDWLAEAHQSDALLDLAPYMAKEAPDDYPDGWAESLLRLQRFGNAVIGLPYHNGPECLIYRSDLFEDKILQKVYLAKSGHPLAVPKTWEEFARVAEFFNRPEKRLYGTVFAAYPDGHNTVYDICLQLWSRGGELFDDAERMQLNTPEMIEALTFYRQILSNKFAVHPKCRELNSVKSGEAFLHGEVAMMINWFGFASVCETSDDSQMKGKVSIAPIPCGPGGTGVSLNSYWMLAIAAGSPHQDAAYRFLRHCMSRENDKLRTLDGVIGCRKSTWTDEEVNRTIPFYNRLETLHDHARELPRMTNWVELSTVIDQMVLETINTDRPIPEIVTESQQNADRMQSN